MAKKSDNTDALILEALERALADSAPRKLHGTKANPGIFLSASAAAKAAAKRCLDEGLVVQAGEAKGKGVRAPLFALAPAGIRYLVEKDPAQQLLAATQAGVDGLAVSVADLREALGRVADHLGKLNGTLQSAASSLRAPDVSELLARISSATAAPATAPGAAPAAQATVAALRAEILSLVRDCQRRGSLQPMDLPNLYRAARSKCPSASVGEFHDALRQMCKDREIKLSPFTQAMYQLPEPELAIIMGREVMYYVVSS
jgi:hypothetical protein